MKSFFYTLLGLFIFQASSTLQAQCTHPDYNALVALYNATDGPNWAFNNGWEDGAAGTDCDVCAWDYVICDINNRVKRLLMGSVGGPGTLPPEIGELEMLATLDLSYWDLTGTIPVEIGNLSNLTDLRIGWNDFVGPIPTEIGNLTNLEDLDLGHSDFASPLPESIGNLTNLTRIFAPAANFNGPIPESLGNLVNLTLLELSENDFSGAIPESLGNLENVGELDLGYNALTGDIPASLANIALDAYLGLNDNNLSGCIPPELLVRCGNGTTNIGNNTDLTASSFDLVCSDDVGLCQPNGTTLIALSEWKAYPNPMQETLVITLAGTTTTAHQLSSISIYQMDGKLVHIQAVTPTQNEIKVPVAHLASGMYYCRLDSETDGTVVKLVKE